MRFSHTAALAAPLLATLAFGACSSASDSGATADDAGPADVAVERKAPQPEDAALPPVTGPMLLSQTGLYSDFPSRTLAADLFTYVPRYEFWADGAKKTRWLSLPPNTKIDTSQMNDWVFPVGTKVWKEFAYGGIVVETRLLMKVREGADGWWKVAYVWKDDGSDAVASPDGVLNALGTTHKVPSQIDCINCHDNVSDVIIGVSALQLTDPTTNPIAALVAAGRLSDPPPANLDFPGTGNVKDALGYLHANCGHCHNDEAARLSTQTAMRLRLLVGQTVEQTGAYTTTVGTVMKHPLENGVTTILVPGSPDQSGLWIRMDRRDSFGMPPTGTQVVDEAGAGTLREWIIGLSDGGPSDGGDGG